MTAPVGRQQVRVLVVEDDVADARLLQRYAQAIRGIEIAVKVTEDAAGALRALAADPYDVMLVDYHLGALTGPELFRHVRAHGHACPTVFLTGCRDERVAVEALQAGALDYLPKDALSASSLERTVTNAIDKARLQRELEEHHETLEHTNACLVERNRELLTFYHTVSHEPKTPLTSIREFVSILVDGLGGPINETQREYLQNVRQSAVDMARTIDDLLDVTRLETGKLRIDPKPHALAPVLRNAAGAMEPAARSAQLTLACQDVEVPGEVRLDVSRIGQVLRNLLSNAIKFTPPGGRITVRARVAGDADMVEVEVTDTGRGIAPEHAAHVFDRLYQVSEDDHATAGGLGLGLNICREIVTLHGGEIRVASTPGEGSTFTFSLPRERSGSRTAPASEE